MSLLVVEIVLALVAMRRGWRAAPLLLVAASAAAFLHAPSGVPTGIAHGLALVGLLAACSADPGEALTPRPARGPHRLRRPGALYQI